MCIYMGKEKCFKNCLLKIIFEKGFFYVILD